MAVGGPIAGIVTAQGVVSSDQGVSIVQNVLSAIRWVFVALVFLAIAAWLTVPALRVNLSDGPGLLAVTATLGPAPGIYQGTFVYSETSSGPTLEWAGGATADTLLLVSDVQSCTALVNRRAQPIAAASADATPAFGEAAIRNPRKILVSSTSGITSVSCRLDFQPLAATYSERRFQIVSDIQTGASDAQWHVNTSNLYQLNLKNAENLQVQNAEPCCASMYQENTFLRRQTSNYHQVKIKWTDVGANRIHEFMYFLGAAFIGLSFSCILEAVRPWIGAKVRGGS